MLPMYGFALRCRSRAHIDENDTLLSCVQPVQLLLGTLRLITDINISNPPAQPPTPWRRILIES